MKPKFKLYAKNKLIGETFLEGGDPPMGVAFGELIPTENYTEYQAVFETQDFDAIESLELLIISELGVRLEPCAGIGVEDCSKEMGKQFILVSILGLDSEVYKLLFHGHVAAYEEQFK